MFQLIVIFRSTELEALQVEIQQLVAGKNEISREKLGIEIQCVQVEEERDRLDAEKIEMMEEIETTKEKAVEDLLPLTNLREELTKLKAEHDKFNVEYNLAMDRSNLYDKDLLEKSSKIKEQAVDLKTLEKLLHEKTKEISNQLAEIDMHQRDLMKTKETIIDFEDVISQKESEINNLKQILNESSEHLNFVELKNQIEKLEKDNAVINENKKILEEDNNSKNNQLDADKMLIFKLEGENQELNETLKIYSAQIDGERSSLMQIQDIKSKLESENQALTTGLAEMNKKHNELEADCEALKDSLGKLTELNVQNEAENSTLKDSAVNLDQLNRKLSSDNQYLVDSVEELRLKASSLEQLLIAEAASKAELLSSTNMKEMELRKQVEEVQEKEKEYTTNFDILQTTLNDKESEYKRQIIQLESECQSLKENSTDQDNKHITAMDELKFKESERESLIHAQAAQIENLCSDVTTLNEEITSKYCIIEELQTRIVSYEENDGSSETEAQTENLNIKIQEMSRNMTEKDVAISRLQTIIDLSEKENDERRINDSEIVEIKSQLASAVAEISKKSLEIENLHETLEKFETENAQLNLKITGVEQYRQEVAKEANQHMEETGEKIKELKTQFEAKQDEVNKLNEEKVLLNNQLEKRTTDFKALESKYQDLLATSGNDAELIKQKQALQDKNEKLTNMCKKYLAKIKQQDAKINLSDDNQKSGDEFEMAASSVGSVATSSQEEPSLGLDSEHEDGEDEGELSEELEEEAVQELAEGENLDEKLTLPVPRLKLPVPRLKKARQAPLEEIGQYGEDEGELSEELEEEAVQELAEGQNLDEMSDEEEAGAGAVELAGEVGEEEELEVDQPEGAVEDNSSEPSSSTGTRYSFRLVYSIQCFVSA